MNLNKKLLLLHCTATTLHFRIRKVAPTACYSSPIIYLPKACKAKGRFLLLEYRLMERNRVSTLGIFHSASSSPAGLSKGLKLGIG